MVVQSNKLARAARVLGREQSDDLVRSVRRATGPHHQWRP